MFNGLEWSESYLLGVDRLDDQHRRLLTFAARLDQAARSNVARTDLADILGCLRDLFSVHFEEETAMMRQAGALIRTDEVNAHLASHRELLLDLENIERAIGDGGDVLAAWTEMDLAASLVSEIAYHDGQLVTALAHAGHLRAPWGVPLK